MGSDDWLRNVYPSNLYLSAFLKKRLHTSRLMVRTVAVITSMAAKISIVDRGSDRFWACRRNDPSPGTLAFGPRYSDTISAFHPPPQACMLPMRIAGKEAGTSISLTNRLPRTL